MGAKQFPFLSVSRFARNDAPTKLGRGYTASTWIQSRETLTDGVGYRRFFEIRRYSCKGCSDTPLRVPGAKGTSGRVLE